MLSVTHASPSRRQFLRAGLGVLGGAVLGACSGTAPGHNGGPVGEARRLTPRADPRPDEFRQRFAGQPRPGQIYFGASVPYYRSLRRWEIELGTTLALHRSYFQGDQVDRLLAQCRADLANDRLPHVSIKPNATWAEVGSGRMDAWLEALLGPLSEIDGFIFLTVSHEPENDPRRQGMSPADFVAMQRRAIRLATAASNVTVVPVLQQWTFDPLQTYTDPRAWLTDEAEVFGVNVFNPWSPTNGLEWRTFGSRLDEVLPWTDGKPIAVGEYGCRDDPKHPGRAEEWLRDAVTYARAHQVVSMSYYHSRLNSRHGSWELDGGLERCFTRLLHSPWVARPTSGGTSQHRRS